MEKIVVLFKDGTWREMPYSLIGFMCGREDVVIVIDKTTGKVIKR